ncbi:MAG: hypothetical protein V3S55_15255 [Nitrospiraceae bacterium]
MFIEMDEPVRGVVAHSPDNKSCYVAVNRANLPSTSLLAVKASFDGWDRDSLRKGTIVEMRRSDRNDVRKYHIFEIMGQPVGPQIDMDTIYLGTVSYRPNNQACYVRVSLPDPCGAGDDIPLSIKATFTDFPRDELKQGTIVTVRRSDPNDARKYYISGIPMVVPDNFVTAKQTEETDMANKMSKDRVKFFLCGRYFTNGQSQSGMTRERCIPIILKAFGMPRNLVHAVMDGSPQGFWIVCRPSQFARFIVYRHESGQCINGIKDLEPELIDPPSPLTLYQQVANKVRMDYEVVSLVLNAAKVHDGEVPCAVDTIDVSRNLA